MERIGIEQAIRKALDDPRKCADIRLATGWDDSAISRIKSGQQGIKLEYIDAIMKVLGYVMVEPAYLDFLAYGCQIGAACRCMRMDGGTVIKK